MDWTTPRSLLPRVAAAMLMTARAPTVKKAGLAEHFAENRASRAPGPIGIKTHSNPLCEKSRVGQNRPSRAMRPDMTISARIRSLLAALIALGLGGLVAFAQDYPSRPVTILVPFAACGA